MPIGLLAMIGLVGLALAIGSCVRWSMLRGVSHSGSEQSDAAQVAQLRMSSLRVWWILLALFSAALLAGKAGISIIFCTASLIGLHEFHRIFVRRSMDSLGLVRLIALLSVAHYGLLVFVAPSRLLPLTAGVMLVSIILQQIWESNVGNYLRTTAGYLWASLVIVLALSCSVALTSLPSSRHVWNAGTVGWTLFLVLLTESSDIAQALVGRRFGRHKIVPRISPGKTWEGLAGGVVICALLSVLLSAPLTTFLQGRSTMAGILVALLGGVLVAVAGFVGDVNISALKREAGLKDSSHLFPGMGGMLDRLDSLTFTAPTLYCYALAWND